MIRFSFRGVQFALHPLTILMLFLALALGIRTEIFAVLLALGTHEAFHMIAALLAGVRLCEIELMPFGGAARMENPYALPPTRLLFTSLAGPFGNLVSLSLAAALAWFGVIDGAKAGTFVRCSATILCFNLLPALPLDGGRSLYALLSDRIGRSRALALGIALGKALAALLLVSAILGFAVGGKLNLTIVLAAVFLFASAPSERRQSQQGSAYALVNALSFQGKPRPARLYAVSEEQDIRSALGVCHPGRHSVFCVYRKGHDARMLDELALVSALTDGKSTVSMALKAEKSGSA